RFRLLLNGVIGRTSVAGVCPTGVDGGGGVWTAKSCWEFDWVRSKMSNVFWGGLPVPVPAVEIRARPSAPTATPSGLAGSVTVWTTARAPRSITLREELC